MIGAATNITDVVIGGSLLVLAVGAGWMVGSREFCRQMIVDHGVQRLP